MAGAGGIEPPNAGTKNRCLTAWRRPNILREPETTQFILYWQVSFPKKSKKMTIDSAIY
jgi:hypothetical protein